MSEQSDAFFDKYVLLSIQPCYARKIFDGTKTVELRRMFPSLMVNQWVILYVSSPVKAIWGAIRINHILQKSTECLWYEVKDYAGISKAEFDSYYTGAQFGYGIFINKTYRYDHPVSLDKLRSHVANFSPPQSFRYLPAYQATNLNLLDFECHRKRPHNTIHI